MTKPADLLPASLPPIGLSREQASAFIGVSATLFDRLVETGKMPQPRKAFGRLLWDVAELTAAFRQLPHRNEPALTSANPWDDNATQTAA